jgi:photosystem II stability/assembly factor-like uncharacterized protein
VAPDQTVGATSIPESTVAPPGTDNGQTFTPPPPVLARWEPLGEPGVGGRLTALAVDPSDADRVLVGGDLLGVARSDDGGETWERSHGLSSMEIARFTFDPAGNDEVWVGTMGGPYRSRDGGHTWEPSRVGLPEPESFSYSAPIEVVIYDTNNPERLLAFGGSQREWDSLGAPAWGAVWESLDSGETWNRLATIANGANIVAAIQRDDGTLLAAALHDGVHRSTDGGRTWERTSDGLPHWNVRDLVAVPGTSVVYAALAEGPLDGAEHLSGGVYRSDDGGLTWQNRSEGLSVRRGASSDLTSRYDAVAVSPVDPETIWTADLAYGLEAIYRSDDGGTSWVVELEGDGEDDPETTYSSPVTAEVLVADQASAQLRFIAQSEYVLRRTPGGEWVDATSSGSGPDRAGTGFSGLVSTAVTFDPSDMDALSLNALDGGQYLRSADAGETWARPLISWDQWGGAQAMSISGDHTYVLLGQFDQFNGIATSSDDQQSWSFAAGPAAGLPDRSAVVASIGDIVALDRDPRSVVATIDGAVYSSSDAGGSWTRALDGSFTALTSGPADELYVADAETVYALAADAGQVEALPGSPAGVDTMTVDPTTGALFAIRWGVDDNTYGMISRWDGLGWTQLCLEAPSCGTGLDRYAADLAVDPFDPNHLIVVTNDLPFHDVIGSQGVLESTDGGVSWTPINSGLPVLRVSVVAFDPHREGHLVIGTMGGGFYEMRLPE